MTSRSRLLLLSVFILSMISSFASQARNYCGYAPGVAAKTTAVSFGDIVIPRDYPIGTTIREIYLDEVDVQGYLAFCDYHTSATWDEPALDRAHYNYDAIYESGIPGVGIRINTWGPGFGIDWLPRTAYPAQYCYPVHGYHGKVPYCGKTFGYLTVQLIKIAPTTGSGMVQNRLLTRARLDPDMTIHTFYLTNTRIITQGCSLTQSTTFVNMGEVKTSDFRGVNSTAGLKDFNLEVDCDANLDVDVTLDGRPAKSYANNIWALDYSSDNVTATGIGLQILLFNKPLDMREPIMLRPSHRVRHFSIPLQARYIQTDPRITPGKADATATVTLTYQ
ncbi:fimbrial adhesin protein precursor [Xenorhabdus mauleonii]|uniref:Fimbrial adhesin protein n=1 Tax=Xenorhabdus mauleonii TaxID=351675 RepID=A0A1I3LWR2_9GAMM|nr:fimbrial protein [Xenorhabdus mauleonii]PHM45323.1 fimbrial adhesin protein precursor [Xenorhabdus mauleonii]SFI89133.1 Pilin (type 1 fimbria component protein) [Xenorhabdus mauleonii]